jgi:DNA-binding ferritin-like protein
MTDQEDKINSVCNLYVASLRTLGLVQQNCHWLTKGIAFYGDHLLFERLYKTAIENADLMAERFIGLFGAEACGIEAQSEMISKLLGKYQGDECHALVLRFEKDVLAFSQQVYDFFEEEGVLTLGLDDSLMKVASSCEEACYLLQQALAEADLDALG